jgi:hypothetical protein
VAAPAAAAAAPTPVPKNATFNDGKGGVFTILGDDVYRQDAHHATGEWVGGAFVYKADPTIETLTAIAFAFDSANKTRTMIGSFDGPLALYKTSSTGPRDITDTGGWTGTLEGITRVDAAVGFTYEGVAASIAGDVFTAGARANEKGEWIGTNVFATRDVGTGLYRDMIRFASDRSVSIYGNVDPPYRTSARDIYLWEPQAGHKVEGKWTGDLPRPPA